MAILVTRDGQRFQERCPVCRGTHLYDQREKGYYAETERYVCPDCGHRMVAPVLQRHEDAPSPPPRQAEDGSDRRLCQQNQKTGDD